MSRITDYILEPKVVYTEGGFLVRVKVIDDYKYKKYIVSENLHYKTVQGTSFTLTDADSTKQASITEIKGAGEKRKLPQEYQEVEYIESTGTQYIDTGIIGNFTENLRIKTKVIMTQMSSGREQAIMGNKNASNNGCTIFFSSNSTAVKNWSGSGTTWTIGNFELNTITEFETTWTVPKGRTANINGTSYENTTIANNQTSNNTSFAIFNDKPSTSLSPAYLKMYYYEIYIDNELKIQLIPCYNIFSRKIGMYDLVQGKFFTSIGTEDFLKGADIVYENVTGDNQIIVSNENLFNINNAIDRPSWNNKICDRTIIDANNFTLKSNATDDWCGIYLDNLDTTKNYTIKFTATLLEGVEGNSLYVGTADANSPRTAIYTNTPKEVEYTFTNSSKIYIKIISRARVQFSNVELAIGTITNYIGHEGSSYSLNFSRIPSEYQEVEYIQTTGTQWINTGIAPSNDIRIKTDIEVSQTGQDKAVFGLYVIGTEATSISNAYHLTPYSSKWYYGTNGGQGSAGTYSPVVGTRYNIDFNCDSHGHILINGQNITAYDETYGGGSYSNPIIGISWRGYSAGATRKGQFKYYSFEMYNKSTQQCIRNFIPCYRKSDNVIGMYDLITQTFYENAGTGTFLKGNDINTYNELSENDKLWNNNGTWQLNNTAITDNYLLEQLQALDNIELYEDLCYVDFVGNVKADMTLLYAGTEDLGIKYIITEDGKKIRTDWRKLGRRKKWMMK